MISIFPDIHFFRSLETVLWTLTECLNIHGTHVTANISTNNNFMFFFVSDLKIVYNNNYLSSITMPWTREEKYFASLLILNRLISLVGRVFANGPEDKCSIPGRVIPKTLKMVFNTSLLNTQQYKVHIESKVE